MHKLERIILIFLLIAMNSVATHAQKLPPPFLVAASEDKAYILLLDSPRDMKAFLVYRKGPLDQDFVPITPEPIQAVKDALLFREMLGADYEWVARTVKAENEFQALRRISSRKGNLITLSLASPRVAKALGRLFVDENVEKGKTYAYRVSMLDYGNKEIKSATVNVKIQTQEIRAPIRLTFRAEDGKVVLSWDYPAFTGKAEDNVTGFNVYRQAKGQKWHKANRVVVMRQDDRLTWTDWEVQNGVTYTYYLTAVSFIGTESKASNKVKAVPNDATPPFAPNGVKIVEEEGQITILWKLNMESDLSHYDIFRAERLNDEYLKLNKKPIPGDQPKFTDTGLIFGPNYFYKVKAYDLSGNASEFSAPAFGKPKDTSPPAAPVGFTYELTGHSVRLHWKPSKDADLFGYYIYRSGPKEDLMRIVKKPLPSDSLTFDDAGITGKGLWPGKQYTYAVACVDNARNVGHRAQVTIAVPDDERPEAPSSLTARSTDEGQIRLSWQPSPSLDVVGYRIYKGATIHNKALNLLAIVADSIFKYKDEQVTKGTQYVYQLAAVDGAGNQSAMTERVLITPTDIVPPPSPTQAQAVVKGSKVHLIWKPVQADDLKGYNIYRASERSGTYQKVNTKVIAKTSFIDPQGKEGDYYKVTSLDTSGKENKSVMSVRAVSEQR